MSKALRLLRLAGAAAIAPAAIILPATLPAHADDTPTAPEVVVSATRLETPSQAVGSTVNVVTDKDIETRGVSTVFDALAGVPGLSFTRSGGIGATSEVSIRGADPGQTQVLIDGVELNDASGIDNSFDFSGLSVGGISRIEVLSGPQSALYGSDSMGGVIDITTRRGQGPLTASLLGEVGRYSTYRSQASVSGGTDRIGVALDTSILSTLGFSQLTGTTERDGGHERTVRGRVTLDPTDQWSVDIAAGAFDQRAAYDDYNTDADNHQKRTTKYGKVDNTLRGFDDRLENVLSLSAVQTDRSYNEPDGWTVNSQYHSTRKTAEYRANLHTRASDVLTLGVRHQVEEVQTSNDGSSNVDTSIATNSAFGQYVFGYDTNWLGLGDAVSVTAGGRYDHHEDFGGRATYRLATAYTLKETGTTLRGSFGTGFKAPSAYQLFAPIYGNRALSPERSLGADAGVEQKWGKVEGRITGFWNRFTNLIAYDYATSAYTNVGRAETRGIETSLGWKPIESLKLTASYTYLDSEDLTIHRPLQRRPRHSGRLAADWTGIEDLTVSGEALLVGDEIDTYSSDRINPGHAVYNARVAYDVTRSLQVFGRIENLLNADYHEVVGYNTPGRSVTAGFKVTY